MRAKSYTDTNNPNAPRRTIHTPLGSFEAIFLGKKEYRGGRDGHSGGHIVSLNPITFRDRSWDVIGDFWVKNSDGSLSLEKGVGRITKDDMAAHGRVWPGSRVTDALNRAILKVIEGPILAALGEPALIEEIARAERSNTVDKIRRDIAYYTSQAANAEARIIGLKQSLRELGESEEDQ